MSKSERIPSSASSPLAQNNGRGTIDVRSSSERIVSSLLRMAGKTERVPDCLRPYIRKLKPYVSQGVSSLSGTWPLFIAALGMLKNTTEKIKKNHIDELFPLLFGLVLVFFGGHYFTTIAAFEAFRICGYTTVCTAFTKLKDNYEKAVLASAKDDLVDDDNDGIADVKQISDEELLQRKAKLLLKTLDPQTMNEGFRGFYVGLFGVVSVLKVRFAQTITLGHSIAEIFQNLAREPLSPFLKELLPIELHRWIPMIISYVCSSIGIWFAWLLRRVLFAFHSSVRGAQMCVRALLKLLPRQGLLSPEKAASLREGTSAFEMIVFAVASMGFLWQIRSGFSLPFPLNLVLLPATMVEYVLMWLTN